jgi:photosystem II stability/assembly factor-like uncharacterized protein
MSRQKPLFALSPLWMLVLLLIACNLTGTAPARLVPSATAPVVAFASSTPTLAPPAIPVLTDTPTEPAATDTPLSGPPTEIIPTPTLGSAIPHLAPGQKIDITYINMLGELQGWGIGGISQASDHVFRTGDGGKTWRDVTPPQPTGEAGSQLQAVGAFRDASTAWVVYTPQGGAPASQFTLIWSTHDGGSSWQYFSLSTSSIGEEFFIPSDMTFVDAGHGWFLAHVGAGMMHDYVAIVATSDGGASWQVLLDPYTDGGIQSCSKNAMVFADDAQTGWLTPDCEGVDPVPHLFRTFDSGSTWQRLDLPAPSDAPAGFFDNNACGMHFPVVFSPSSEAFAMKCRDMATFKVEKDYLYWTADSGQSWRTTDLPAGFTVLDFPGGGLYFPNATAGLALSRKIYSTTDGGKTWSLAKLVNWDGHFSFLDINTGWAVARDAGQIALVTTSNGGAFWQQIKPVVAP